MKLMLRATVPGLAAKRRGGNALEAAYRPGRQDLARLLRRLADAVDGGRACRVNPRPHRPLRAADGAFLVPVHRGRCAVEVERDRRGRVRELEIEWKF